jgi:beta-alanine degradation protein BauB
MRVKLLIVMLLISLVSVAMAKTTHRACEIQNAKVEVWQTIIYPGKGGQLKMHRHNYDRVLVALTDGELKVKNAKGEVHFIKLQKGHSLYLTADAPHDLHSDENVSGNVIKVIVVNLKKG